MTREELMQEAKPILFNTGMVRAILDDRKSVTRRVIRKNKVDAVLNSPVRMENADIPDIKFIKCLVDEPYQTGDILYVRETWLKADDGYHYRADETAVSKRVREDYGYKWHPSIYMPKEAARIWLRVTDVHAERLQDITKRQAEAEGAIDNRGFIHSPDNEYEIIHTAKEDFMQLWDSTIKKSDLDRYGWNANPWVWVIAFERLKVN